MKKYLFILFLFVTTFAHSAPTNTMSISPAAVDATTITTSDENTRNNAVSTTFNAHDHDDIDQVGNTLTVGDGTAGNKTIQAGNADASKPFIRYDDTNNRWVISRDGSAVDSIVTITGSDLSYFFLPQTPTDNDLLRFETSFGSSGNWTLLTEGASGTALSLSGSDLVWTGMYASGDLEKHNGTSRVRLPIGIEDQFLRVSSGQPIWETVALTATADVNSFTRDVATASGNQSITGVGFQPSVLHIICTINSTATVSVGFCDSGASGGTGSASSTTWTDSNLINMTTGASDSSTAVLSSFDSDGFTLTWTKSGSPTGTANCRYLAIK